MSSLKEMHGSVTDRDRERKRLKELEYQSQLQAQIEEKRRFKEMEKYKTDLELEKEMKRYAATSSMDPNQGMKETKPLRNKIFERRYIRTFNIFNKYFMNSVLSEGSPTRSNSYQNYPRNVPYLNAPYHDDSSKKFQHRISNDDVQYQMSSHLQNNPAYVPREEYEKLYDMYSIYTSWINRINYRMNWNSRHN